MSRDRFEERIRVYIESAGDEELKKLINSIGDLGDVTEEQADQARAAMRRFADAIDQSAKVQAFADIKREIGATETKLNQAQAAAQALHRALANDDSAGANRQRAAAAREVNQLTEAMSRQQLEAQQLRSELSGVGIDTRQLGTAQARLRSQMGDARVALADASGSIDLFRRSSRQAANEVETNNRRIAGSFDHVERSTGKLRSIFGGIAAYLGFREAAQGAVALGKLASEAENAERSFGRLYGSQERGAEVVAELRTLAKQNGLAFQQVADDAKKLKAFGLDPLNGSYQALIDQNAAMGGSQEELSGIVLALGQAWAKQKLQGEEILQLVERGVPVWSLLEQATGKNVQQLQKLSEQGKLGRETITQLYEAIGKNNAGAAAEGLKSLSGLLSQVSAKWQEFWLKVANNGVTDYFKTQIQGLLDSTGGMDGMAKRVADGILGTLEALKRLGQQLSPIGKLIADVTLGLAKHAEAVLYVAKVYAALKIAQVASGFLSVASSAQAAAGSLSAAAASAEVGATGVARFGRAVSLIPKLLKFSVITLGIDVAITSAMKLSEAIKEAQEAQSRLNLGEAGLRSARAEQLRIGQQLQKVYGDYANVAIKSSAEIGQLSEDQAVAYEFQLEQAKKYFQGVALEAHATGNAQREAFALEMYAQVGAAIDGVSTRLQLLADAAKGTKLDQVVDGFVQKFDELAASGKSAADAISGAFNGIDLTDIDGLKAVDDMITQISTRGHQAGEAVRTELRGELQKLSAEDLKDLRGNIDLAFGKGSEKAKLFAGELGKVNAAKLGVDLEAVMTGFSAKGRDAITEFENLRQTLSDVGATGAQKAQAMAQAFDTAFKQISTKGELEALKAKLQEAFKSGDIGLDAFQERVKLADNALQEMSKSGAKVGMTVADAAAKAGESLKNLASDAASVNKQMENSGHAVAAVIDGVKDASDNEKEAAERAKESAASVDGALQQTVQTAASMKEQLKAAADAYSNLGLTTRKVSPEIAEHLKQVKLAFVGSTSGGVDNILVESVNAITQMVEAQGKAVDAQVAKLQEQLAKLEPVNKDIERLKQQYSALDVSELQRVADLQAQLRQARAARRAAAAPAVSTDAITSAAPVEKIILEVKGTSTDLAGIANLPGVAKTKLLDELATGILQRINRSRGNSNRPRLGR